MFTIRRTDVFAAWLDGLRDRSAKARLIRRLERAAQGNLGDVAPVGAGVLEMREHFGPGWRMYFIQHGNVLIVMLGGGDKSTQEADIAAAKALAAALEPPP
jgi:putative addiction module killer protein